MAALSTGQAQATLFSPVGRGAGVSSGVRQALAPVGGAVETNDIIRREARFVERRVSAPFGDDQADIRAAAAKDETPMPEAQPDRPSRRRAARHRAEHPGRHRDLTLPHRRLRHRNA